MNSKFERINIEYSDIEKFTKSCPSKFNLAKIYKYKIFNQRDTMMCVSTSVLTAIEYLRQIAGMEYKSYSRIYNYCFARIEKGEPKKMTGLRIDNSICALQKYGIVEDDVRKDNLSDINVDISERMIKRGLSNISYDIQVYNLEINVDVFRVKLSISTTPIVAVIYCTEDNFYSKKSIIQSNTPGFIFVSHCVCIVGYNDEKELFIFQNSYGKKWKYSGFGKLHYSFISSIQRAVCFSETCVNDEISEISQIVSNTSLHFSDLL